MDRARLIALHGHFLLADSVKQLLLADVPVDEDTAAKLGDLLDSAQFCSRAMRLQVFYALLYVVVEGYRNFGFHDVAIDTLLQQSEYLDALRRFRNAVCHPQDEPISPKLMTFLKAEGSEDWIHELYAALKAFFESQLPIEELLERLPRG
jgi:hypothetical protein